MVFRVTLVNLWSKAAALDPILFEKDILHTSPGFVSSWNGCENLNEIRKGLVDPLKELDVNFLPLNFSSVSEGGGETINMREDTVGSGIEFE